MISLNENRLEKEYDDATSEGLSLSSVKADVMKVIGSLDNKQITGKPENHRNSSDCPKWDSKSSPVRTKKYPNNHKAFSGGIIYETDSSSCCGKPRKKTYKCNGEHRVIIPVPWPSNNMHCGRGSSVQKLPLLEKIGVAKSLNNVEKGKSCISPALIYPICLDCSETPDDRKDSSVHKGDQKNSSDIDAGTAVVYCFDHGELSYLRTSDTLGETITERIALQSDHFATRFWAEVFGTINVGTIFIIAFILQFYRFIFCCVIRPLSAGVLQLTSDYLLKPLLAVAFNGFIQPFLILGHNIASSLKCLLEQLAEATSPFTSQVAQIIASFRVVEIRNADSCNCKNKV